ncbi:MAG: HAD hydrolase family protein [Thermococci archaeon]|nr:HAD hydrolase family protein [Thermococci archaeon]
MTLSVDVPNFGKVNVKSVVFDLNGTLGSEGHVSREVKELLTRLAGKFEVIVLSADTFGTLEEEFRDVPVEIMRVGSGIEKAETASLYSPYVAIGNGNNDVEMFKRAELSFCVVGREGASTKALMSSDIVVRDVRDAIEMLLDERKLVATLRG